MPFDNLHQPIPVATQVKPLAYRRDIDGLRAVAVLSVVLYHAGIGAVPGGFVGVDIFFVISGYLISTIIFHDLETGKFSLGRFYERRIRRIQPALVVMALLTAALCAVAFVPMDFKLFAQSVGATVLFSSNIYFYLKSGYFDPLAETKPLLHTWSLAVEEQYYLLFPLLALLLWRHARRHLAGVLAALALASFAFSVWQARAAPTAAFYLPFDRVWELLAGALLASGAVPPARSAALRTLLGCVGLAAMLAAVFLFSPHDVFPGERALLPCLGAALLIHAGQGGSAGANALLSTRPMVFTGRISYSLYLWHWPLIVVAQYVLLRKLRGWEVPLYLALAYVLAWASWKWIEQPWRDAKLIALSRSRIFGVTAGVTAAGIAFAVGIHVMDGMPGRFSPEVQQYAAVAFDTNPMRSRCDSPSRQRLAAGDACTIGAPDAPLSFALLGDSFGDALAAGVDQAARDAGKRGLLLTHSGCFPLAGVRQSDNHSCDGVADATLKLLARHPEIGNVVIAARWTSALLGTRFGQFAQDGWFLRDDETRQTGYAENRQVFQRGMLRTLHALEGRRITVLAYIPEQRYDVPRAMALQRTFGWPRSVELARDEHERRQRDLREAFRRLAQVSPAAFEVIDVGAAMCGDKSCAVARDGVLMYADDNHLSRSGAILMKPLWRRAIAPVIEGGQ
ncbi:acyltransferase family protein [Herbaspirillum sp.]|uniref:acyltransferase family protein n=1 Tax=Herbaspirillum sp. TaxID=1890675 RepID=UPI0031D03793